MRFPPVGFLCACAASPPRAADVGDAPEVPAGAERIGLLAGDAALTRVRAAAWR